MCRRMIYLVSLALMLGLGLTVGVAGASEVKINFQSVGAPIPDGYLPEYGDPFFEHDDGWSYGWDQDMTGQSRDRDNAIAPDQRYDTTNHIGRNNATWEIEIENGVYNIFVRCCTSLGNDFAQIRNCV